MIGKQEKEENIYKNVPEKVTAHTENEEILEKQEKINNTVNIIFPDDNKGNIKKKGRKKMQKKPHSNVIIIIIINLSLIILELKLNLIIIILLLIFSMN